MRGASGLTSHQYAPHNCVYFKEIILTQIYNPNHDLVNAMDLVIAQKKQEVGIQTAKFYHMHGDLCAIAQEELRLYDTYKTANDKIDRLEVRHD